MLKWLFLLVALTACDSNRSPEGSYVVDLTYMDGDCGFEGTVRSEHLTVESIPDTELFIVSGSLLIEDDFDMKVKCDDSSCRLDIQTTTLDFVMTVEDDVTGDGVYTNDSCSQAFTILGEFFQL